jgi:hypothetical protein
MNLADPQQWNAYTYANNNPTTTSDPTGQCATADGPGTCFPPTTSGSTSTTSGSTTCSDINKYSASCGGNTNYTPSNGGSNTGAEVSIRSTTRYSNGVVLTEWSDSTYEINGVLVPPGIDAKWLAERLGTYDPVRTSRVCDQYFPGSRESCRAAMGDPFYVGTTWDEELNPSHFGLRDGWRENLLELSGVSDVIRCSHGNAVGCGWAIAGFLPVGRLGKIGEAVRATRHNYRDLFLEAHPEMSNVWQVHHALPQKYEGIMRQVGVNIHERPFLRGVNRTIHTSITNEWSNWERQLGPSPSADEVTRFSYYIDEKYGQYFVFG